MANWISLWNLTTGISSAKRHFQPRIFASKMSGWGEVALTAKNCLCYFHTLCYCYVAKFKYKTSKFLAVKSGFGEGENDIRLSFVLSCCYNRVWVLCTKYISHHLWLPDSMSDLLQQVVKRDMSLVNRPVTLDTSSLSLKYCYTDSNPPACMYSV